MNGLGWRPELEERHRAEFAGMVKPMFVGSATIPDDVDPSVIPCNDQGPFNSCEGNARSKVAEYCSWIKTGRFTPLSARYSYLTTKLQDGTIGEGDQGASITGGAVASQKYGECLAKTLPYWDWSRGERFSPTIPPAATNEGADHRLRSAAEIRSLDEAIQFLGLAQGGILIGINWDSTLAANTDGVINRAGGRFLGGHAICFLGYRTRAGEKWPKMWNSHSARWGNQGTALVNPRVVDSWIRNSQFGAMGLSDLPAFGARQFAGFIGVFA